MTKSSSETIRDKVRERYGATAGGESTSCHVECCTSIKTDVLGYSAEDAAITYFYLAKPKGNLPLTALACQ